MGIILSNDHIEVEIGDVDNYQGSRFDRAGFIRQVRLHEHNHTFCTAEHVTPNLVTGGGGLCNEFGILSPIGYDEAAVGESFTKIGVGLLVKKDQSEYSFQTAYAVDPFDIKIQALDTSVQYSVEPKACNGYAVRLVKRISIREAELTIDYCLSNEGDKAIRTEEYVHNFIGINQKPIGPDYELSFNFPLEVTGLESEYTPNVLKFAANTIRWSEKPKREFYCQIAGFDPNVVTEWDLVHLPTGIGVREISNFHVTRMAVWGAAHVVSPEVFIQVEVQPGESRQWTRRYEFYQR